MEETLPEWIGEEQVGRYEAMSWSLGWSRIWGLKRSDIMSI
jgi:hypothetical protein